MQVDGFKIRSSLGKIANSFVKINSNSSSIERSYTFENAQKYKELKQEETKEEAKPSMKAKPKFTFAYNNNEKKSDKTKKE